MISCHLTLSLWTFAQEPLNKFHKFVALSGHKSSEQFFETISTIKKDFEGSLCLDGRRMGIIGIRREDALVYERRALDSGPCQTVETKWTPDHRRASLKKSVFRRRGTVFFEIF